MCWPTKFKLNPISGLSANAQKLSNQSEARKRQEFNGVKYWLGSNTYLHLYLNTQISVFVFVFENPQDEIFVFVFDRRIWVYSTNIFQMHFSFLHFNT